MDALLVFSMLAASFMLGALPAAFVVTRWLVNADIRRLGTGNPGAANVFREVGRAAGISVATFDIGKGAAAVLIAGALLGRDAPMGALAGLACVAGHSFSPFMGWRGGAGLAPAMGSVIALLPPYALAAAMVGMPLLVATHNVGRSAAVGFVIALLLGFMGDVRGTTLAGAALMPLFVSVRTWVHNWRRDLTRMPPLFP